MKNVAQTIADMFTIDGRTDVILFQ